MADPVPPGQHFFRITAGLFTPEFCLGAGVLLVSYDDGPVDTVQRTPSQHGSTTTAPAGVDDHTQAERDVLPVRVRRIR